MRTIILAGAAIVALGSMATTSANAGGVTYIAKELLWKCFDKIEYVKPEASCGANYISKSYHKSNDDNTQKIKQKNKHILFGDPEDLQQLNVGVNVIGKGDGNYQKIKQSNFLFGDAKDTEQTNVGVNVIESGDDNSQTIKQSNAFIGDPGYDDVEQVNVASNYVGSGDGNSQSIEQSNTSVVINY